MTDMSSELSDVKTSIAELRGELRAMAADIRSGDRDSTSGVRLLAETVKHVSGAQAEQRADLKEAMSKFDERTTAVQEYASTATSTVRVDLERQISEHAIADSPHSKTLGARLDAVETRVNQARGALALLTFAGAGGIYAVLRVTGNG